MKTSLLFIPSLVIFITLSGYSPANHVSSAAQPGIPSTLEIGNGLKDALQQGTSKSSGRLSAVNGFFGNAAVKILFPPQAQKAEKTLRSIGLSSLCDKVILSLNRAAEDAAK